MENRLSKTTIVLQIVTLIAVIFNLLGTVLDIVTPRTTETSALNSVSSAIATNLPAPTVEVTAQPTLEPTPEPELLPADLLNCSPLFAKVELKSIPQPEGRDQEIWAMFVFGGEEKLDVSSYPWYEYSADRITTDRWGDDILDIRFSSTLEDIPTTANTIWIYNQFGILAGRDYSFEKMKMKGYCQEIDGTVEWTKEDELTKIGTHSFQYPTDKGVTGWSGWNFKMDVFEGKEMSWTAMEILKFRNFALREGTNWSGLGFFGPSSSTHGSYTLDEENQLVWNFNWWDPDYEVTVNTGITLPVGKEIIVVTKFNNSWYKWQRGIIREDGSFFEIEEIEEYREPAPMPAPMSDPLQLPN